MSLDPRTRDEHLAWCKTRALAYLPDIPGKAYVSMMSDLRKHPETADHPAITAGAYLMLAPGWIDDPHQVRVFIEGFK